MADACPAPNINAQSYADTNAGAYPDGDTQSYADIHACSYPNGNTQSYADAGSNSKSYADP